MKPQTRIGSLGEALTNIVIGFTLQNLANYFVLPLFGFTPSIRDLLGIGAIMTVISIVRSYGIRRWNEYKRGKNTPPDFQHIIEEFAIERTRQISGEGFTLAHDDEHDRGELASAAAAYCLASVNKIDGIAAVEVRADALPGTRVDSIRKAWPWGMGSFNPTNPRRNLIKAGAMIVAEIGRLDRAAKKRAA